MVRIDCSTAYGTSFIIRIPGMESYTAEYAFPIPAATAALDAERFFANSGQQASLPEDMKIEVIKPRKEKC